MRGQIDKVVLIVTLLLVTVGVVMVYSSSAIIAFKKYEDSLFFLKRQILWTLLGIIGMIVCSRIDYRIWQRFVPVIMGVTIFLLILILLPHIGSEINGARRWFRFGPLSFQPSETAKLAVLLYLSDYLVRRQEEIKELSRFCAPLMIVGMVFMLIVAEPDLGTAFLIILVSTALLFIGGVRLRHLSILVLAAPVIFLMMVLGIDYRMRRLLTFFDPWKDPQNAGFQIVQSFLSFGNGGLFGVGLGEGRQKLFFLPEPYTDFIFAALGEELGLIGGIIVVLLFFILSWKGFRVALSVQDPFGSYLATGITLMFTLQTLINMGVVTGLLPTKGIPLPLVSFGGSSLLMGMISIGILLNISRAR